MCNAAAPQTFQSEYNWPGSRATQHFLFFTHFPIHFMLNNCEQPNLACLHPAPRPGLAGPGAAPPVKSGESLKPDLWWSKRAAARLELVAVTTTMENSRRPSIEL